MKTNNDRCSQCSSGVAGSCYIGLALRCIDLWRKNGRCSNVATFLIGKGVPKRLKPALYAISCYIATSTQKQQESTVIIGKTDVATRLLHRCYIDQEVERV